ncbi:MAG: hypothetical protein ACRC6V_08660 [Bacteroidales bacterium]
MMIINGWLHLLVLAFSLGVASLCSAPTDYAKIYNVEFMGAQAMFIDLMIKWFIACGVVEFCMSIFTLIGKTFKD